MVFWKRSLPPVTHVYQESIAHRVRDILTGTDHPSQKQRDKAAIKALQRPEALAGVIEILKTMPEPGPQADDWGNSADDSSYGEGEAKQKQKQSQGQEPVQPVQALFKENDNKSNIKKSGDNSKNSKPNGTTIVAATTIAAAAATSAAAAALAVSNRKKNRSTTVKESTVTDKNTTITTKTIVRFHPSKDTVSSCAYWWGYEIFIPQPALSRIASAQDVSTAFLGFLSSVGLVVPAIVPFLGYIAAYVGLEFAVIKAQNEGKGVILASTWLVPVALVPRAWDVPDDDDNVDNNNGGA